MVQGPLFGEQPVPPIELQRPEERQVNLILGSLQRIESGLNHQYKELSGQISDLRQAAQLQISEMRTEIAVLKTRMDASIEVKDELEAQRREIKELRDAHALELTTVRAQLAAVALSHEGVRSRFAMLMLGVGAGISALVALAFDVLKGK